MLKKIITLVLFSIILTGCSHKKEYQELTFSSWGTATEVKILKKLITDFEKENPSIKINFMHIPQNYFQKLHLLIASNTAPDVIFINNLYLPLYATHLKDLTGIINQDIYYNQPLEALSIDNKIYAIPRDASNLVLYINTDIIKNVPKNLDEIVKFSLDTKSKNIFGISFEDDVYFLTPYLSYFGENFNKDFIPENSKGLSFYKDLRNKYNIAPTKSQIGSSTLAQMFIDEKIAMYLSGRWMFPKIEEKAKFNWIIAQFPIGEQPQNCDASGWAISKNTKNEQLAIEFIKYLSSENNIKYFTETGLIIPANKKAAKLINKNTHNEQVFLKVLEYSKSVSYPKNYKKIADKFNSEKF